MEGYMRYVALHIPLILGVKMLHILLWCNKIQKDGQILCAYLDPFRWPGHNFENNAWKLEHNAEELQEILNRIMQWIVSI